MPKRFLGVLFGVKPKESGAPTTTKTWREAPIKTVSTDVGHGIVATMTYPTGHHGFVQVVGESNYQDTLLQLSALFETVGRIERTFVVKLVPEPDNPFDPNAVAVMTEGDAKVGYLSRAVAKSYQKHLREQKEVVTCPAKLTGGEPGKPSIGIVLDFKQVRKLKV
jgi:hypothetical protein